MSGKSIHRKHRKIKRLWVHPQTSMLHLAGKMAPPTPKGYELVSVLVEGDKAKFVYEKQIAP